MTSAVDLFAGPGGFDLAAHDEGLTTVGIEHDSNACATRRAAGLATIQDDVRAHGPAEFPEATVLLAGPPCQTYTLTGNGTGRRDLDTVVSLARRRAARQDIGIELSGLEDERTGLVLEPLRWILEAKDAGHPYRVVVLEQVPQVLPVWETYAELLVAEGYRAVCGVLNAERYGTPQTRRRAALLARLDTPVALPAPTHAAHRSHDTSLPAPMSMADVLPHRGEFTVISNYGTGGDSKNRGRRHSSEPAFTVTGKISRNRLIDPHGEELPRFTHSEAGRLQGFPADHPWSGSDIPQQIGNAVPVPLGRAIIRAALAPGV